MAQLIYFQERKAERAAERTEEIALAEIDNLTGARHLECQAIKHILADRGLAFFEVGSSGF